MWFKKRESKKGPEKSSKALSEYFNSDWLDQWKENLSTSEKYKKAGKNWNNRIVLKFDPIPDLFEEKSSIGFFLDLQYGECKDLRYAVPSDEETTDIILKSDEMSWIKLLEEKKDPTMMIMKGKLKLEKGSLVTLSTQRSAAKALLETAPVFVESLQKQEFVETIEKRKEKDSSHQEFTTIKRGLNFESTPMKLFQKAKVYGVWNPADIDFTADKEQWENLSEEEQEIIIHLSGLFLAGEEAVTLDLLPLIQVIAKEGRLEEEIFLTSFLWEEAKHTEFFSMFIIDVIGTHPDFHKYHKTHYRTLFYDKLPADLNRLQYDDSPLSQLKASATYNMIVEGTLAETGYAAYYKMLSENNLLPGLQKGITLLKQDESRHIAFGLYLINRLIRDHPKLKSDLENHLEELLNNATNIIHEIFEPYDVVPFGLEKEWFLEYALKQFQHRMEKLGI